MCNLIYISTTSTEDLRLLPSPLYQFTSPENNEDQAAIELLRYPNKWFLLCQYGGCSCHYRHLHTGGSQPFFGPPEEWFPEDDDDIESTAAVYDVIARLVSEGHQVDILDTWSAEDLAIIQRLEVSLSDVPRESFRFFEGYVFDVVG